MAWSAIESIISLIAPDECKYCHKEGQAICKNCFAEHIAIRSPACFWCNTLTQDGLTCARCKRKTAITGATVQFRLQDNLRECIFELKYYGNQSLANMFAEQISLNSKQQDYDLVTYVPATGNSYRKRGYNQAQLLAKAIAKRYDIPCRELLLRTQHIDQIGLSRSERLLAVQDNFIAKGNYKGKSILLVDDVITTGATLNECALQLKKVGAKQVWGVAIAKK